MSDLTKGKELPAILKLALPIMGTSFVQMAYNMTDIAWLGRLGSDSVAAVGAAGFLVWLGNSLMMTTKIGAEVGIAQSIGRSDMGMARRVAGAATTLALVFASVYALFSLFFAPNLIGFFGFSETGVAEQAILYLRIVSGGMVFAYLNQTFSGVFNGKGDGRTPFYVNTLGLVVNMALDPLLIFGYGPFPAMGVAGAAMATVLSQFIVAVVFAVLLKGKKTPLGKPQLFGKLEKVTVKPIVSVGFPVAAQMALFSVIAMVVTRLVSGWGALPVAVQSVGAQIEAISWMTASGFATALGTFTGQNFGSKKLGRIKRGYFGTLLLMTVVGLLPTLLFVFFGKEVFSLFIPEKEPIELGGIYLRILAVSQIFMIWEITTSGLFNGVGKSNIPSYVGIVFTALRIPAAIYLSDVLDWGVEGIWWAITFSSILKGVILVAWAFARLLPELNAKHDEVLAKEQPMVV
ncbi:MATE family efflux transporter [Fulvitalea axinellae]|uniref:Multidrug-efflux transporter n=1 Tax=Fulvitalea axinellae TaxID=1182444 RepID=A0AAU9CLL6_9BACT|nr:MATE family efflux transporter [Fulvitalea axinellae]